MIRSRNTSIVFTAGSPDRLPTKHKEDGSELKKHSSSHLEGTSRWLLDSPIFQQWHDSRNDGILWIRGVPGTGKSVLASRLIHQLSSEEFPVLYFFFRHTIQSNHRPESALRDWLAQALPFSPPLQLAIKNLIYRPICLDFVDDLSLVELWHLVRLALRDIPRAHCVIDALDEMDNNALENKKAINPDISTYLGHRLAASKLPPETRVAVKDAVFKQADGLFLYAKLTMDKIVGLQNESEAGILESIERMPVNLSVMYRNILREHMDRTGLPEGLQMLVLQLITHAIRPLRLLEISDCIKITQPQYGQDTGTIKNHVRSCCGPLLEVLPDETVRVVHQSLTEYLFGLDRSPDDGDIPLFEPGATHNLLANLCLSYLQSGYLGKIRFQDFGRVIEIVMSTNQDLPPFMDYALKSWHAHIKEAVRRDFPQQKTNDRIFSLLMVPTHVKILATLAEKPRWENGFQGRRDPEAPLETEVLIFSIKLDSSASEQGVDLDYQWLQGPKGDESNLELGLADINDHAGSPTFLLQACKQVDPKMVSMLLEAGADPNICQLYPKLGDSRENDEMAGPSVLHALEVPYCATKDPYSGYKRVSTTANEYPPDDEAIRECFRLVTDAGADVNHVDNAGNTPLHLAEIPLMAQLLLESGADITAINCRNNTPLHVAQNLDVMKMILSKTDIDIRD
ncbi:ankyrin repeat-containing protein [Fusarium denticulatum]|uniref:Ankyrin repeat-containing protein n=1 Tax=Fusarium denticulatum TaxID=48507 RepID=A0A8H5UCM8_9HYPO|nr:ankyrin repeat-containing protein [Fusarium denticulatum]